MAVNIPQVLTEGKSSGASTIEGSLRFDKLKSNYLTKTPGTAGNRKIWTWSSWIKAAEPEATMHIFNAGTASTDRLSLYISASSPTGRIKLSERISNTSTDLLASTKLHRDPSGWYHMVLRWDTTNTTEDDRVRLYVNGEQLTAFDTRNNPGLNHESFIGNNIEHTIGYNLDSTYLNSSLAQCYFVDGQSLGPEEFGFTDPLTSSWRPKKFNGSVTTAAVAGTTLAAADNGKPFYNTTDSDGQIPGSGYVSGATTNGILLIPGISTSEEGISGQTISNNGASTTSTAKWYGSAIEFGTVASETNVDKNLDYGTALGLSGANNFTMEAWVYPRAGSNGYNMIFEGDWNNNNGILFLLDSSRHPELYLGNGSFEQHSSNLVVPADTWSHVAVVCDNNTMRFFVNGAMDVQGTRTKDYGVGGGYRYVGAYRDSNHRSGPRNPFFGYMQDIRVTSDAKYTSSFSVPGSGALAAGINGFYLPFDGNSPIGEDQSGNECDYTPVNFGGSTIPEKATGAKPILNTDGGGKIARPGVFGSEENKTVAVTVSNATGQNKYYLDTVLNPTLPFIRGTTITFDTTDSSNNTHPFKLSSTNADSATGTEYTDGVSYYINGSVVNGTDYVSNYATNGGGNSFRGIKWTVPHNVSTTYYYCTSHTGMGNNGRLTSTTDETKADPYAWKCVLALPLVGRNSDFSDEVNATQTAKTITSVNNAASSIRRSNFYGSSFRFDGSDDYLQCGNSTDYDMDGDFTAEAWVMPISHSNDYAGIFGFSYDSEGQGWNILVRSGTGKVHINVDMNYTDVTNSLPLKKWTHVALVRSGTGSGNCKIYINGVADPTTITDSDTTGTPSGTQCLIGSYPGYESAREFDGYIQDARIYKGVAKYTRNFIPASSNPDIRPDTPSGVPSKTQLDVSTDGCVALDGNGDALVCADNADWDFGTGDFTVECFAYFNETTSANVTMINRWTGVWTFQIVSSTQNLRFYTSSANVATGSNTIGPNRWHHFVAARETGTLRLFIDGVESASSSFTVDLDGSTPLNIGAENNSQAQPVNGFISNVRIIKGTALYTKSFTPPTRALTTTSQGATASEVKLLCCQETTDNLIKSGWYRADTLYTTKSDIVNNGTLMTGSEVGLSNQYFYLVPGGAEGKGQTIFSSNGATTNADSANRFYWFYRDGGSWSKSSGVYNENEYTLFTYGDDSSSYQLEAERDFYVLGSYADGSTPVVSGGQPATPRAIPHAKFAKSPVAISNVGDASAFTLNPFNTDVNTVRGREGVYCTINPLSRPGVSPYGATTATLSNGNLDMQATGGNYCLRTGTMEVPITGKWYFECIMNGTAYTPRALSSQNSGFGLMRSNTYSDGNAPITDGTQLWLGDNGYGIRFGSGTRSDWVGDVVDSGDVMSLALDMDTDSYVFKVNNKTVESGQIQAGARVVPFFFSNGTTQTNLSANFGQNPFRFTPPKGYQPLTSSTMRPDSVIPRGNQYVSTTLWSGNNVNGRLINVGFQPDLIWVKAYNQTNWPWLTDSVRGTPKKLYSNDSSASDNTPIYGQADSFNRFGFIAGGGTDPTNPLSDSNQVGTNYVAWSFKAGGNKNTFNVDDVGYSSPADVSMNPGSLNSVSYDQSTTWSNCLSADGGSGFTNQGVGAFGGYDTNTNYTYVTGAGSGTNYIITFTPPTRMYYKKTLQVRVENTHGDVSIDGGTTWITNTGGFVSFKGPGSFTTIKSRDNRGQFSGEFHSIRIDGRLLADTGVTPENSPTESPTGASVGTKQGFAIIKHTGTGQAGTLAHGLSEQPEFLITKSASTSGNWAVYTNVFDGSNDYMYLDSTAGKGNSSLFGTANGTFSFGYTADEYIHYLWHSVPGLQKFGTYEGGSNSFVELGFKPALLLIKNGDGSENWNIFDSTRSPINAITKSIQPNLNAVEYTSEPGIDFLSNGFQLRGSGNTAATYFYAAWAEVPTFNVSGATADAG